MTTLEPCTLNPIGLARTPYARRSDCPRNVRQKPAPCRIELVPAFSDGLKDLASCSHVIVLYWLHAAARDALIQTPPFDGTPRGVFATRSPNRPNPIGFAAVPLTGIEGTTVHVLGLDCLDGTPVLDLKPYFASTDAHPDATVGWFDALGLADDAPRVGEKHFPNA